MTWEGFFTVFAQQPVNIHRLYTKQHRLISPQGFLWKISWLKNCLFNLLTSENIFLILRFFIEINKLYIIYTMWTKKNLFNNFLAFRYNFTDLIANFELRYVRDCDSLDLLTGAYFQL